MEYIEIIVTYNDLIVIDYSRDRIIFDRRPDIYSSGVVEAFPGWQVVTRNENKIYSYYLLKKI